MNSQLKVGEQNLRLNKEKTQLRMLQSFVGHISPADGLKPDRRKVEATNDIPDSIDL